MKKKVCKKYTLGFSTGIFGKSLDLWWNWEWNMNSIWLLAMWNIGNRSQNLQLLQAYLRWVEKPRQEQTGKTRVGVSTYVINFINIIVCLLIKAATQIYFKGQDNRTHQNMQFVPIENLLNLCAFFSHIVIMHHFPFLSNSNFSSGSVHVKFF